MQRLPPGNKVFVGFDCLHMYFQVLVNKAYRHLTTFHLGGMGLTLLAEAPMDKLAMDLFYVEGKHILLKVGRFSGFLRFIA